MVQGRVVEAKRGMARALLTEAPDPEALVLLLQVVADEAESHEPAFGQADGWAVTLVERFGALGVDGLRALAERFPEPESFGWMQAHRQSGRARRHRARAHGALASSPLATSCPRTRGRSTTRFACSPSSVRRPSCSIASWRSR